VVFAEHVETGRVGTMGERAFARAARTCEKYGAAVARNRGSVDRVTVEMRQQGERRRLEEGSAKQIAFGEERCGHIANDLSPKRVAHGETAGRLKDDSCGVWRKMTNLWRLRALLGTLDHCESDAERIVVRWHERFNSAPSAERFVDEVHQRLAVRLERGCEAEDWKHDAMLEADVAQERIGVRHLPRLAAIISA
jgi:hypothetical protein